MTTTPRRFVLILIGLFFGLAACQPDETPTPDTVIETVLVTQVVNAGPHPSATPRPTRLVPTTQPSPTPTLTADCCQDYRIAILQDPGDLNPWAYWGGASSSWAGYIIADQYPTLYTAPVLHSPERPDFVPALASDLPRSTDEREDVWVITVELLSNVYWSDGEPIDAQDVAFTVETALGLQLDGHWARFYNSDVLFQAVAVADNLVEFHFSNPISLADWQAAAALAPIMPQHFWQAAVSAALEQIADLPPVSDCQQPPDAAAQETCQTYASARSGLYSAPAEAAPSGGAYVTHRYLPGESIILQAHPDYYATGMQIRLFADGTWERQFPQGASQAFYGQSSGERLLQYQLGPFSEQIEFLVYPSLVEAQSALAQGEVDYVLNPSRFHQDLAGLATVGGTQTLINPQNASYYLAFNLRKSPFNLPEFRQAVEILLDKEFLNQQVLQGAVQSAYSFIPAANSFWAAPVQPDWWQASRQERLDQAVAILKDAGWRWRSEPFWDAEKRMVVPGQEARLPGGEVLSEIVLLAPAEAYDPHAASYNLWLAQWLRDLGIAVRSELTNPTTLFEQVLIGGVDFDMYILGWELTLYPDYLCQWFYSDYDTFTNNGFNTTGFNDAEFDNICQSFWKADDFLIAQEQVIAMQAILQSQRPYIPLFYPLVIDQVSADVELPYTQILGGMPAAGALQDSVQIPTD